MAGMLYLPRLFVYHANVKNTKETNDTFVIMENRLLRYIMNPAMILTWAFGIFLVLHPLSPVDHTSKWFMIKFILVLIMSGLHGYFSYCRKKLLHNNSFYSPRYLKYLNEAPTILMIIIVIMVVVRPFN
jgi:putative membrane protein